MSFLAYYPLNSIFVPGFAAAAIPKHNNNSALIAEVDPKGLLVMFEALFHKCNIYVYACISAYDAFTMYTLKFPSLSF